MMLNRNPLQRFLEKITPTLARGSVLEIHLDRIIPPVTEDRKKQLLTILNEAAHDKRCLLLEGPGKPSLFIYFQENKQDDIAALLIQIQFNLGIDPDAHTTTGQSFYTLYPLQKELDKVKQIAGSGLSLPPRETSKTTKPADSAEALTPILESTSFSMPFTPALLAGLEKSLSQADLGSLMRRQAVCALVGNAQPVELFEEIYVALTDLKKALCPTVDIYQSPWLLDRLLETLDKRVLENISRHDAGSFRKNFSLNIAVKTILSPEFQAFNDSIEPGARQSILFEIKQADIFGNLSAYLAARSFITELGYRICIDTVTIDSLAMLDRKKLGGDFTKLIWTPELLEASRQSDLKRLLDTNESRRMILCRVDDKRAIEWGQSLGISLFQGYYVQKLLYQTPRKKS